MTLHRRLAATRSQLREAKDAGIGTLEYIGIVCLAAILITGLILGINGFQYGDHLSQALCKIASLGAGNCASQPAAATRAPADYIPPEQCVKTADGAGWEGSIAVGVKLEGGQNWLYEDLGDGRVRLTRSMNDAVGAEVGAGFEVTGTWGDAKYGAALAAGAAAMATAETGDVFYAANREEAEAILGAQRANETKSSIVGEDNWARDATDWVGEKFGGSTKYEDLEPDETFTSSGLQASGTLQTTLIDGTASAAVEGGLYEGRIDRKDGTATDKFTASASGSADAGIWLSSVEGYGLATASFAGSVGYEVDRDADGNPTAARMTTLSMGHADASASETDPATNPEYTETTIQIPLDNAADRLVAARLAQSFGLVVPGVTDQLSGLDMPGNILASSSNATAFEALARSRGYVNEQRYTLDDSEYGAVLDAKYILEAGLGGSYSTVSRKAVSNTYWNGQEFVARPGC